MVGWSLVDFALVLPYFCLAYKSFICVCIWMILNLVVLVMMKQILHRNDKKKTNGTFSNSDSWAVGFPQKEASQIRGNHRSHGSNLWPIYASSSFGELFGGGSWFRLLLPGELARHSVSEGTKVRHLYVQRFWTGERWKTTLVVGLEFMMG